MICTSVLNPDILVDFMLFIQTGNKTVISDEGLE